MIQAVINRMASNSFLLKGWTVMLVSALFALAAFFALALFKLNPIGLILASGMLGLAVYGRKVK